MIAKKRVSNDHPWPEHWEVSDTWDFNGKTLITRQFEVCLTGESTWHLFNRYVVNTKTGKEWLDCFALRPYGAFESFRPDRVARVRVKKVVVPRPPKVKKEYRAVAEDGD